MPRLCLITAVAPDDAHHLKNLTQSVLSQDFTDWEWMVVEDGPDRKAAPYLPDDPRVSYMHTARQAGPAMCRNIGVAGVDVEWVRNIDCDDWFPEEFTLTRVLDDLDQHPEADYGLGKVIEKKFDGSFEAIEPAIPAGILERGIVNEWWEAHNTRHTVSATAITIKQDTFFLHGGYGGLTSSEDTALLMPVAATSRGLLHNFATVVYQRRAGSITTQDWHRSEQDRQWRSHFVRRVVETRRDHPGFRS